MFESLTNSSKTLPDALRAKLATLTEEEDKLTREYQDLAVAAADGSRPQSDADKAHATLVKHRDVVQRTELALDGILRRDAKAQEDLARGVADTAWRHCIEASRARESVALKLENKLAELGPLYAQLCAATAEVCRLIPPGYPRHDTAAAFAIGEKVAADLVKHGYSRNGLPGGPPLTYSESPVTIGKRYADSTACIVQARDTVLVTGGNA
jgi:hypothetical protein